MKRSKGNKQDNESEDEILDDDDDGSRPPPIKVKNIRVDVDIPRRKVVETPPKLASVQVRTPNVEILVQKPPSIWSRLRDIYSAAEPADVKALDETPVDPKVPLAEVGQESPPLRAGATNDARPAAEQQRPQALGSRADSEVKTSSSELGTEELSDERHTVSATEDSLNGYQPASSASRSPKISMHAVESGRRRREATIRAQTDADSTAAVRIVVNSDKHLNCRSYGTCRRLKDESNYLGLSIFNALPEDQNVCLSIYGISFLVSLVDLDANDSKASFRETLKFGALVPKEGGRLACSCKEVVTTLRRRAAADTGEVTVNTETYFRPFATINQQDRGKPSTENATSHIMTAEIFRTFTEDPACTVCNDVLFNTACFENLWKCPFSKKSTYTGSFFNQWTDKVTVQVMRKTCVLPYSSYPGLEAHVVCLPYADGALCMVLIVQRSSSSGLVRLTPDAVRGFVHGTVGTLVTLHMPKFHLSTSIDMAEITNELASANYESEQLLFRQLRQDAHISVDEGHWPVVSAERTSFAGDHVTIVVNKPFHFVITERTSDLILYAGRVMSL
ncbi:plasminogen activator inhibitor 1-like [Dermacentor variabilis]|uniref:plasminogen activator inhibitor 1-like n=1 Tax=Dermacentor variabilis TaxID=34621 RepID=UPI003F5C9A12